MNIIDIINKKRCKEELTKEEIRYAVLEYVKGNVKDYQMSALLMSICINGMTQEETCNLTDAMLEDSLILDLSYLNGKNVDKHSTGGVGDKTTLLVAPIVSACGVSVLKMSGRGLGFTGGTIDKLESIKGFNVNIEIDKLKKQIEDIGLGIIYSSKDLVLADKKMYALRDVTGTVESIPLIASSIMSKKIASGNKKIVIDVKVGNGALMKNKEDAKMLATYMIEIGKRYGVEVRCILSSMDTPLGCNIGNGLEVKEAAYALATGLMKKDLYDLVVTISSHMVSLGKNISLSDAERKVKEVIENKSAYQKLVEMVKYQGGNLDNIEISKNIKEIRAKKEGYIHHIDALGLANLSFKLGSGRGSLDEKVDLGVGISLLKKEGDYVLKDDVIMQVYYGKKEVEEDEFLSYISIKEEKKEENFTIIDIIS